MTYLEARNNINSLFGVLSIAQNTNIIDYNANPIETDSIIYDTILRDNDVKNLGREIDQVKRRTDMKFNKRAYINEKNTDLIDIAHKLKKIIKKKFLLYLNNGFTQEEAQKKAYESAKSEEAELLKLHKLKFPKEAKDLI